tara:strand:+ start:360 stop:1004 length:645 start_codon:yes stop_codon:yes gene_type:complete
MIVSIVDYGSGNLRSVAKGFERAISEAGLSMAVEVTSSPARVALADRVILPGVGAFADCKRGLDAIPGLLEALSSVVCDAGRPFLGICVGMQLMGEQGLENGVTAGFGWVRGNVEKITSADKRLKIPHMGWNELKFSEPRHPVLAGLKSLEHSYFVHSYKMVCKDERNVVAWTDYGGSVTAAIGKENLFGTQFHPEKSQEVGLKLMKNFLTWRP